MTITLAIEIGIFFFVGFAAQFVDGALGMAYGVINMTIMLALGIPPSVASASVHLAEVVTTGVSGLSHAMFKNVDYKLFRRLIIPGIIGSVIGAYVLTKIPIHIIKPIIAAYLVVMGFIILYRALAGSKLSKILGSPFEKKTLSKKLPSSHAKGLIPLGLAGGFFDAAGGGGWGPIVTSSLLAQNTTPHYTIGTVNFAEFLIALSSSIVFFFTIGIQNWPIVVGLLLGGMIAAPIAAFTVRIINPKIIMLLAGLLIVLLSLRTIFTVFF